MISSPGNNGETALYCWSWSKDYLEFSKWLLEQLKNCMSECNPPLYTIQDNDRDQPLMLAVANHHLEIVCWLVSIDPDCMKTQKKNKRSVLHYAAANNNTEIASVLLKALESVKSSEKLSLISSPDSDVMTTSTGRIQKVILNSANGCLKNPRIAFQNLIRCYTQFKITMETRLLCMLCRVIILKLLVGLPALIRIV